MCSHTFSSAENDCLALVEFEWYTHVERLFIPLFLDGKYGSLIGLLVGEIQKRDSLFYRFDFEFFKRPSNFGRGVISLVSFF